MERTLEYKKYLPTDLDSYLDLVSKSQVMKYITEDGRGLTEDQAGAKFRSILEINGSHPTLGYFQVRDADTQQIVGECKLVHLKDLNEFFEMGYLVKSEFWRQGIGSKICTHLLELAYRLNPRKDVVAIIDPANLASKNLLTKFELVSYYRGSDHGKPTEKLILRRR